MERKTCSKDNPMPYNATGKWQHPDAELIDEEYGSLSDGGSYEKYKCPNCGKIFKVSLPD